MRQFISALVLIVLCFINNFAQQTPAEKLFEIKGIVKNQEKISLAGLNLYFESNQLRSTIITNEDGAFVAKLSVGKYKITANAEVSKNFLAFIQISDNRLNPTSFELVIETDKSCCSLMSDENNTEVIKYIAPPFPAAARAVRASGEVVVLIKINSEGKVISTKAVKGHPLFRVASEQAAKQWLFSNDKNSAEREGKIIFAFAHSDKEKSLIFTKPNRLEIFATSPQISP